MDEIKKELLKQGGIKEEQIISQEDIIGWFKHCRSEWVISKLKNISAGKVLLDAGAGQMPYKTYCRHLKYIAQDFGKYDPSQDHAGVGAFDQWDTSNVNIKCDIIDMPLEDNSIDVILCTEVFEHLKNPVLALKEFSRVMKSGGTLLLTAPVCSLPHMTPYYYFNGFSEYWYRENLADYGFEMKEIMPDGNLFMWLGQELFRTYEMAEKYSDYKLQKEEISVLAESINIMKKLSSADRGSAESLCFGYMIEAYKKD